MRAKMIQLKKSGVLFVCFALISITGCDQISSLFGKNDSEKNVTAPMVTSPVVVTKPSEIPQPNDPLPPDIVARVGKWSVSINEFNERLSKLKDILPEFNPSDSKSKRLILEEMIRQELLVMDAEATGIASNKDILDTVEDFRKTLLVQELATELTKDIEATESDAREYYNSNKNEFIVNPEWKIREIVVLTESEAKDILVLLLQGADFSEMAKSRSKGPTASKGGDSGFISKFPFEQMQSTVASLDVGKISSILKGPNGYYIVKLEEKKGGEPKSFTSVKNELVKGLTLKKQQEAVLNHLNTLASKVDIKVNEDLLK